jgi:hypothetical protein
MKTFLGKFSMCFFSLSLMFIAGLRGQENIAPITYNPYVKEAKKTLYPLYKTTTLSLPFFTKRLTQSNPLGRKTSLH